MFESTDMLPRPPPMPSAPLPHNGVAKPSVPEISIILDKEKPVGATPANEKPATYAEWKKKNLPTVGFTTTTSTGTTIVTTRSTIYPFRTITTVTASGESPQVSERTACYRRSFESGASNAVQTSTTTTSSVNNYPVKTACCVNMPTQNAPIYRHSLENLSGQYSNGTLSLNNFCQNNETRRTFDTHETNVQRSFPVETVLTLCASTQTETRINNDGINADLSYLVNVVKDLQEEQRQMRQLMETFLIQQHQQQQEFQKQQQQQTHVETTLKVYCADAATQCEILKDNYIENKPPSSTTTTPFSRGENGTMHQALPNVKFYSPTVQNTTRPLTQSTQYLNNRTTPTAETTTQTLTQQTSNNATKQFMSNLPKPATETSVVMNQLALKYLPSEKLNELMQDIQITRTPTPTPLPTPPTPRVITPLREIDNFNRSPADISTASYRYLSKYRLLPHEQSNEYTTPQNEFQTPTAAYLGMSESSSSASDPLSPHLDLEHIRRQPKFL